MTDHEMGLETAKRLKKEFPLSYSDTSVAEIMAFHRGSLRFALMRLKVARDNFISCAMDAICFWRKN